MNIKGTILEDWAKDFCMVDKTSVPDGAGGFNVRYTDGATFTCVQRHDSTIEAQVAEKADAAATYTIFADKSLTFDYYDIIKRKSDGQLFRITEPYSKITPGISGLELQSIKCEKFNLKAGG